MQLAFGHVPRADSVLVPYRSPPCPPNGFLCYNIPLPAHPFCSWLNSHKHRLPWRSSSKRHVRFISRRLHPGTVLYRLNVKHQRDQHRESQNLGGSKESAWAERRSATEATERGGVHELGRFWSRKTLRVKVAHTRAPCGLIEMHNTRGYHDHSILL